MPRGECPICLTHTTRKLEFGEDLSVGRVLLFSPFARLLFKMPSGFERTSPDPDRQSNVGALFGHHAVTHLVGVCCNGRKTVGTTSGSRWTPTPGVTTNVDSAFMAQVTRNVTSPA